MLFTDLVGSTELSSRLSQAAADKLRQRHFSLLRRAISANAGTEVKSLGDGLMVVFRSASSAVACAAAMQQAVEQHNRASEEALGLRVGLSAGEATLEDGDYFGDVVIEAARLCATADGGRVLATGVVRTLAGRRSPNHFAALGPLELKGLPEPVEAFEVAWEPRKEASDKATVLVVDDHPLWRQTLRSLIERAAAASQVLEAGDGAEAIETTRRRRPDVVIMDMALPGVHGLEATRQIAEASPRTRVLVLSSSDDEEQVMDAVRAGATGYLLKTARPNEILEGLRRVQAGELVFPRSLTDVVLEELRGGRRRRASVGPLAALTEREIAVLEQMAEGHTNDAIGKALHLSAKTVEAHVTSIFSKLGLDPAAGGHRRVLAVITYLRSRRNRINPRRNGADPDAAAGAD